MLYADEMFFFHYTEYVNIPLQLHIKYKEKEKKNSYQEVVSWIVMVKMRHCLSWDSVPVHSGFNWHTACSTG